MAEKSGDSRSMSGLFSHLGSKWSKMVYSFETSFHGCMLCDASFIIGEIGYCLWTPRWRSLMKHPKCKRGPEMKHGTLPPEHLFMILSKSRSAKSPHIYSLNKNWKLFSQRPWVSIFTWLLVPLVMWGLWEKTLKISSHSFSCFASLPKSQSTFLASGINLVLGPGWNDAETCRPSLGCFPYF